MNYPHSLPPFPQPKSPNYSALRIAARRRCTCPSCGRPFSELGLANHKKHCTGPEVKVNQAHVLCPCGRKKAKLADMCFRCEGGSALDAVVREGRKE